MTSTLSFFRSEVSLAEKEINNMKDAFAPKAKGHYRIIQFASIYLCEIGFSNYIATEKKNTSTETD
jgi:hypothetical protein